jgi:hypothetical protein
MAKVSKSEREEAISRLREWIKPGDTVYTTLRHVSRSGMSRDIDLHIIEDNEPRWISGMAATACDWRRNKDGAVKVGGCGMDMGFHLVEGLSCTLYGREHGYKCLGKGKCPSNYHVNHRERIRCEGTRVYNPDGPDTGGYCYAPSSWHGEPIPENWPRLPVDIGEGQTLPGRPLHCIEHEDGTLEVCPTCKGVGSLPNPEGPERFDLKHTDGYAIKHRWM